MRIKINKSKNIRIMVRERKIQVEKYGYFWKACYQKVERTKWRLIQKLG